MIYCGNGDFLPSVNWVKIRSIWLSNTVSESHHGASLCAVSFNSCQNFLSYSTCMDSQTKDAGSKYSKTQLGTSGH